MDGKRKRKSGISSPEVPVAKTSFDCRQGICVNYFDQEDDGVHGCRMKPLASLEVNQHLLQGRDLQGGFANSTFTKTIISPSAVTAAAKITARAREKARICLLDDSKENAFPKGAEGFGPFRGSKRKWTPEGLHATALRAPATDSPRKVLEATKLETDAPNGGRGTETHGGSRERLQFSCMRNSVPSEPAQVQTVSVQTLQCPSSNGYAGTDALYTEGLLQSSQDSSKPVLLASSAVKPESIAARVQVARSDVEHALHGNRETSMIGRQHSSAVQKTFMDNNQASTTSLRPVALALNAEAHLNKMGPSPLRQTRKEVCFGRMYLASSTSTSKHASPVRRGDGKPNATDRASYKYASVSHGLPSKPGLARTGAVAPAARTSHQSTCNLSQQHAADISKPEISGHSTITVRVNPNLARQSSCMSSSQPLPPTGRKPRVFKARSDSLDGDQLPCLQKLDCKAPPGEVRIEKGTPGRAFPDAGLSDKLFPHQSRFVPRYLSLPRQISLPSRQKTSNRPKKTGYSKFRPVSLDSAKDVRKDSKKLVALTEPAGLLGDFNPGIISRIRDSKQVQAILGAVVGSDAMEATASFRLQRKQRKQQSTQETAVSNCERTEPLEWILPSRLNEDEQDDKHGVNTASADGMRDRREDFAIDGTGNSQAEISSCHQGTNNLQQPTLAQDYRPAYEPPKAEDITTDHLGIPGTKAKADDYTKSHPSEGHAFPMDPRKSCAVATVACRWLELVGMDIKGRLAALKRSRRRFRNVVCSGELDVEVGPFAVVGPEAELQPNQHALQGNQWKTLFMNMDGLLSVEGGKLESSLKQVTEMQVNCRQALEYACDPSTSGLASSERKKRDMILAASAASIFSAANFASMLCN